VIPPSASVLDRFRIVLRHRDKGAGSGAAITAAPLEQRHAAEIDRGRQVYDAQTPLPLRHRLRQDRRQSGETNDLDDGCERIGFHRHTG
jgi:hypothetical protein